MLLMHGVRMRLPRLADFSGVRSEIVSVVRGVMWSNYVAILIESSPPPTHHSPLCPVPTCSEASEWFQGVLYHMEKGDLASKT